MDTRGLVDDGSDSLEDEASTPSARGRSEPNLERSPSERYAFLFRHNLDASTRDLRSFHPPLSQILFLLSVFSENVNCVGQLVHVPTVTRMVHDLPGGDATRLTPANEALMFSVYYSAVIAMEEDDVSVLT
jgi:hypothetical protein